MISLGINCEGLSRGKHGTVVGSSKTSDGIPALRALPALATLVRVVADGDIGQNAGVRVEPRIDESKRSLTSVQELIVDQRENTSEGWGAGTSTTDGDGLTAINDNESPAEGGDIRSSTALGVVG